MGCCCFGSIHMDWLYLMTCYLQYICVLYSKWSFGETYLGICQQLYDGFPKPQQQRKTYQLIRRAPQWTRILELIKPKLKKWLYKTTTWHEDSTRNALLSFYWLFSDLATSNTMPNHRGSPVCHGLRTAVAKHIRQWSGWYYRLWALCCARILIRGTKINVFFS